MFLGIANAISGIKSGGLSFIKDNLKLYLDFKSTKSDTLKFPSEGSTEFDGTEYVRIPDSDNLSFDNYTVSFWAKFYSVSGGIYAFINKYDEGTSSKREWRVICESGVTKFVQYNSASQGQKLVANTTSESANVWNHYAFTHDGSTMTAYRNGIAEGTTTTGGADSTLNKSDRDVLISASFNSGSITNAQDFHGQLANLAIWSRCLEPEEVQSIMNKSYSQLKGVEKTSLVSWWALDSSTTGSNLIADSGFDDANYWSAGSGWSVNGTTASKAVGADVWSVLQVGSLLKGGVTYRFTADVRRLSGIGLFRFYAQSNFGANIYPYESNGDNLATYTQDLVSNTDGNPAIRIGGSALSIEVDNFTVQELNIHKDSHGSNDGSNIGATINSNVYGGNAPILPRAVDVAKEGQADAIGNGSASFVGSNTDAIVIENGKSPSYPFTLTAWVYPELFNSWGAVYNAWVNDSLWWGIYSHASLGRVRLHLVGGNDYIDTPIGSLPINEWSHIATTWDGTNAKTYINGIAQTMSLTGTLAMPTAEGPPAIGIRSDNLSNNPYTGDIAQLGIFAGALTQAQVQSVMESTSYSKIPADVKSTLGSELITNGSFDADSDWYKGAGSTIQNGRLEIDGTQTGTDRTFQGGVVSDNTKLYKYTIKISGYSSGNIYLTMGGFNSGNITANGTYSFNSIPSSGLGQINIYYNATFVGNVDEISIKEVINEIVAYYPLDGDSEVKGLSFDGTDDTIQTSAHDTLVDTTYTFWAKSDVTGANGGLFGHGGVTKSSFHFNYFGATGGARFFIGGNYFKKWDIDEQDDGQWHHYAIIADADSIADTKLYVDGLEKTASTTSSSGSPEAFTQSLTIGSDATNGNEWEGSIAQFAVYSDLKDSNFILNQYNQGIGVDLSSDSNLTTYYKMDNATTVTDLSSNSNDGTVNGATLISAGTTDSVGNNDGGLL